jgi:hypothetical protein
VTPGAGASSPVPRLERVMANALFAITRFSFLILAKVVGRSPVRPTNGQYVKISLQNHDR